MPINNSARPITDWPIDFIRSLCEKMKNRLTAASSIGRLKPSALPPRPNRVIIHAVTVVPILAPMMTATAPANERSPALTKLTTITVVADELWMTAVTVMPVRMPLSGLPVKRLSTDRIREPAIFCRPSLISFMAKRNTASAPAKFKIINKISSVFIAFLPLFFGRKITNIPLSKLLHFG